MATSPIDIDGYWLTAAGQSPEIELVDTFLDGDACARVLDPSQDMVLSGSPLETRGTKEIGVVQNLKAVLVFPELDRTVGVVEVSSRKGFGVALTNIVACPYGDNMPSVLGTAIPGIDLHWFDTTILDQKDETKPNRPQKPVAVVGVDEEGLTTIKASRSIQTITLPRDRVLSPDTLDYSTWYLKPSSVVKAIKSLTPPRRRSHSPKPRIVQDRRKLPT